MNQFKTISNNSIVLTKDQFMNNLTVFGINWSSGNSLKLMPMEFKRTIKDYFNSVHEDDDYETLSMDEFFLLFMRIQPKLDHLNKLLGESKKVDKPNYIFDKDKDTNEFNARWRVELKLRNRKNQM